MPKTDISVRELVDKVQHNDLILPEMQRRYVWTGTRVRDLLDSLYRCYPSGTILVWETDDSIKTRSLAVGISGNPTTSQKLLLLDGQQRLTSLTAVLNGQPIIIRNRKRPIDILFNLEHPEGPPVEIDEVYENGNSEAPQEDSQEVQRDLQEELKKRTFVVSSPVLRNDPHWVNVSDIFTKTDREILKPIGINSDDEIWEKYSDRLKKVRDIKDYQYVMQVLQKNMSYEEVTEIFVRVNSLGAKLRSSDLALAQITSKWRGFMDLLEKFADEFGDDSEYVAEWVAIRMLTVCATKQCKFKSINRVSKENLEVAWTQAKAGMHFAINFLRNNAGIECLNHISASMLIIPIAVYASLKNEKLSPLEEKQLLKWFYYAHMRGHYGMGSSESILNADLAVLYKTKSVEELLKSLFAHVKQFEVTPQEIAKKGTNSPFFTMLYYILKHGGAKDWFTGIKISEKSTGSSHTIQYHHIFPKSLLQRLNVDSQEINEISNLAFISGSTNREITNKEPKVYLQKQVIERNGEETLVSQLIPLDKDMWELSNYNQFLDYRREAITKAINKFMKTFE
ncbi:MAG: DUF262 domain-containing protein [Patescibacteria group bacterium]